MYALVEFTDDSEKEIVDVSSIKRFDSENVGYNKKYKVQWEDGDFYDAFILIIGETIEEVQKKKETTRIRKPNRKFAESDVATSSETELDARQKKKENDDGFAEQFQKKMVQMKAASEQKPTTAPDEARMDTDDSTIATEEKKREAQQKGQDKQKDAAAKQQQAGSSSATEGVKKREAQQKEKTKQKDTAAKQQQAGSSSATEGVKKREGQQKEKTKQKDTAAKQQQAGSISATEEVQKREAQQKGKNKQKETAAKQQQVASSTAKEVQKREAQQKGKDKTEEKRKDKEKNTATKHDQFKAKKSSTLQPKSLNHSTDGSAAVPSTGVSGVSGTKKGNMADSSSNKKETRFKDSTGLNHQPLASKPKITSIKSVENKIDLTNFQSHSTKQQEYSLKKTIAALMAENERYKKLLKEKDEETTALKEINSSLQVRVIAEFEELRGIIREMQQVNLGNAEHRENNALFNVGYRREADSTIHIGRNVWLSCTVYDSIVCISRSNAQFVKNCAIGIFGTETLMASSVTGSASNRTRKTKNEPARPKLDAEKLLALRDIYRYYLLHVKKLDEVTIDFELSQVGTFVSQKIYELNRAKTKKQTPLIEAEPDESVEDEPAEDDPAEEEPAEDDPAEEEPAEDDSAEEEPAEDDSMEDDPAEAEPMESDGEIIDGEREPDTFTDGDD